MLVKWGLLDSEREAGKLLSISIGLLRLHANKFGVALGLADHCDEYRVPHDMVVGSSSGRLPPELKEAANAKSMQYTEWTQLAADAGAISVYNFAEIMQTIDGLIGMVPTAKEHMHGDLMKRARRAFEKAFPDYVHMRFAVAHAGKPFKSPETFRGHAVPGGDWFVINMLEDRTLHATVNGKDVQYSLVGEACEALHHAADLVRDAFAPVGEFTAQYSEKQQRETPQPQPKDQSRPL